MMSIRSTHDLGVCFGLALTLAACAGGQPGGVQLVACDDGTGKSDCCPATLMQLDSCTLQAQECWLHCDNGMRGHLFCVQGQWVAGLGIYSCDMDAGADASVDSD